LYRLKKSGILGFANLPDQLNYSQTMNKRMFNSNKKYSYSVLIFIGALFNLLAVFREDSGALVAVGCSLIVLGIAARKRIQES